MRDEQCIAREAADKRKMAQKAYDAGRSEQRKAYYQANKEKYRVRAAEYFQRTRDAFRERAQRWLKENPERAREYSAKYYAENKANYRARERSAYAKNPEKFKARSAAKRAKNPEAARASVDAWRAKNPDALAHNNAMRRTRQMRATPVWADLGAIKAVYKRAALLSQETGQKWHVDHEIPLKHPLVCGLHNEFNLRVIPGDENQSKGNRFEVPT